jgi:hypothetical protein
MQEMQKTTHAKKRVRVSIQSDKQETEKQRIKLQMAETRLLDAYSAGAVTVEQLKGQMERVREQKTDLDKREAELTAASQEIQDVDGFMEQCRKIAKGLKILEKDQELKQKFLRKIVNKIVIYADRAVIHGALPAMLPATNEFRALSPSL